MRLIIIRHAIAVPRGTPDVPDDERTLTRRGRQRFRSAAAGLARLVKRPDFVLSSPLPRARETADIAAREWGKRVEVTEEAALAGGTVEEISKMLEGYPGDSTVAIVGHEPDLSELLARVLGTPHERRLTFKKGGAAMVELSGSALDGGGLIWYLPPRLLREAR